MRVYSKMWAAAAVPVLLLGLSAGGCTASKTSTVALLDEYDPAPDLGRPGWIRTTAGFSAWVGGAVGFVVSLAVLPVTYPVSLLMDEPLGYARNEFRFLPVGMCASGMHYALAAPLDAMDFILRRGWLTPDKTPGYDFTPMPAPTLRDPAMEPVKTEPMKTEPMKTEPMKTEPMKTEPMEKEPAKKEPAKKEPAKKEPDKKEPDKKEQEPAMKEPAKKDTKAEDEDRPARTDKEGKDGK
jgi:outer membrane biosynthesis protein TonB